MYRIASRTLNKQSTESGRTAARGALPYAEPERNSADMRPRDAKLGRQIKAHSTSSGEQSSGVLTMYSVGSEQA